MTEERKMRSSFWTKDKIFVFSVLLIYLAVNAVLVYYHEPWRDEAQAWLLARDLSPWQLMLQVADEGHPVLWHFILMPFAKLGFPFKTIEIISLVIMGAAAYLMLDKAPFHKIVKCLLVFSPAFIYFDPVIARNYCLIALFSVLMAVVYPERREKPLRFGIVAALLVQTHIIMLGFAALLCAGWLVEEIVFCARNKARFHWPMALKALLPPLISAGIFAVQLLWDVNTTVVITQEMPGFMDGVRLFVDRVLLSFAECAGFSLRYMYYPIALLAVIFLATTLFSKNRWTILIVGGAFVWEYLIYTFIYMYSTQRILSLSFILIWFIWINYTGIDRRAVKHAVVALTCVFCLIFPIHFLADIRDDLEKPYSNAGEAAAFIRRQIPAEAVLITHYLPSSAPLSAYLPDYRFYHPQSRNFRTFPIWKIPEDTVTMAEILALIETEFPDSEVYLILSDYGNITGVWDDPSRITDIFHSEVACISNFESYHILKLN